jgi:hypothetical protein
MSANSEVLQSPGLMGSAAQASVGRRIRIVHETSGWNPEAFAREQIRTLVRRVFFNCETPIRQVLFTAVGRDLEPADICSQVGEALALESTARVGVVIREPADEKKICLPRNGSATLIKDDAVQLTNNLWRINEPGPSATAENAGIGQYWVSRLAGLRSEFDFAVIQGPAAGSSSEAALLAELADGIVLVLEAGNTRKASARKVKECLQAGSSRILGTVLSERLFPIPERIYQRL